MARRRAVLALLVGLLTLTGATAPVVGALGWGLAVVVAALLGCYVAGLRRLVVKRRLDRRVGDLDTERTARRSGALAAEGARRAVGAGAPVAVVDSGTVKLRAPRAQR